MMKNLKKTYKVCEIVQNAIIAGTEKHVYLIATNINKEIFMITVCTFEYGPLIEDLKKMGIDTAVLAPRSSLIHLIKLIFFLRRQKFDIVHCHSGGYACIAAKIAGIRRIIYTKHGIGFTEEQLKNRGPIRKLRDFLVNKCVDIYIALTQHDKEIMEKLLHIKGDKIRVIYNGIPKSWGNSKIIPRRHFPTIGTIARLCKQKGISYLIESIPLILKRFNNLKVIIGGSGEDERELKELSKSLGVSDRISFLGYVENVAEVIQSMDVFILPSLWEGFPYVLLEAMLLKKPIVATNIFGINEIVEKNKTGILIKPKDSKELADAVITLLSNADMAERFGNASYKRVMENFTLEENIKKIENLYNFILKDE